MRYTITFILMGLLALFGACVMKRTSDTSKLIKEQRWGIERALMKEFPATYGNLGTKGN